MPKIVIQKTNFKWNQEARLLDWNVEPRAPEPDTLTTEPTFTNRLNLPTEHKIKNKEKLWAKSTRRAHLVSLGPFGVLAIDREQI